MKLIAQTAQQRRGTAFWRPLGVAGLLLLMIVVSHFQFTIIWASTASFILTPIAFVFAPEGVVSSFRVGLLQYWIASAVWLATFGSLTWALARGMKKSVPQAKSAPSKAQIAARPVDLFKVRLGLWSLIGFSFVALTAPFLAPWDPTAQGDLTTTRLLPPMQRGSGWEIVAVEHHPTRTGSLENKLAEVDHWLLHRTIRFAATGQGKQPESTMTESRSIRSLGSRFFFFGTDALGRDIFSRVIYGTRVSLGIALAATIGAVLLGAFVGFLSGMVGGFLDAILMRTVDLFLSLPSLFIILAVISFLGNSIFTLIFVLTCFGWMGVARLVRGEVLKLREREFIQAAKLLGVSRFNILRIHMLPNLFPLLLVGALLQFGNTLLAEAALSFLGLGIQPPTPSWGIIMGEAMAYLSTAWWMGVFPGVALVTLVVSAHMISEGLEGPSSA